MRHLSRGVLGTLAAPTSNIGCALFRYYQSDEDKRLALFSL